MSDMKKSRSKSKIAKSKDSDKRHSKHRRDDQSTGNTMRSAKEERAIDKDALKREQEELAAFQPSGDEPVEAYSAFNDEIYPAFDRILERARDLNTQIPVGRAYLRVDS